MLIMRWICGGIHKEDPSDTVHERIDDYELLTIYKILHSVIFCRLH